MLLCTGRIAAPLQRLRQAELRRNLKRVQADRFAKRDHRLVVLLLLRINQTQEVLRVGIVRIQPRYFLKIIDRRCRVPARFFQ